MSNGPLPTTLAANQPSPRHLPNTSVLNSKCQPSRGPKGPPLRNHLIPHPQSTRPSNNNNRLAAILRRMILGTPRTLPRSLTTFPRSPIFQATTRCQRSQTILSTCPMIHPNSSLIHGTRSHRIHSHILTNKI